jgi:hypothetical protein
MSHYHENNILINETFIVDHSVKEEWLEWFSENIVTRLSALTEVADVIFSRVGHQFNPDGVSFALQFRVKKSDADIMNSNNDLQNLRRKMFEDFDGFLASFISELYIIYGD